MARLTAIRPVIGAIQPRLRRRTDAEGHSRTDEPWRAWYGTRRWKALRLKVFVRDEFRCQCGCGALEGDTSKLTADHKIRHRGNPRLFWDPANIQTLRTSPCHVSLKQRQERAEG